ncbi:MAG: hypothetical protein ACTTI3_00420 [Treponema sp.]
MTEKEWHVYEHTRSALKRACIQWLKDCGYAYAAPTEPLTAVQKTESETALLHVLQKAAADKDGVPFYPVETPIVYNHSLDAVQKQDTIKLIVVGDNPGKNEQLHTNQRYLVGQAGKVAENFFKRYPALAIDFRKEVIILNKTPIHTAKTKELLSLLNAYEASFYDLFIETQCFYAAVAATLQKAIGCPLWLVGYGELRKKACFTAYAEELKKQYAGEAAAPVFVFQHFSMNCFANDLAKHWGTGSSLADTLYALGLLHRKEILGW